MILLKNLRSSFEASEPELIEGTNGRACEIMGDVPFMLSLVEAFIGFFSRIRISNYWSLPAAVRAGWP